uniref:Tfiih, polypeptide, putative n=1 Tax=Arundo donax TaxID=35708 RepID=A0A0A9G5X1_ARUDO
MVEAFIWRRIVHTSCLFPPNGPFEALFSDQHGGSSRPNTRSFSSLPAEELPHFWVELPSYDQSHSLRVLPEQVSTIPCMITALFKQFLARKIFV